MPAHRLHHCQVRPCAICESRLTLCEICGGAWTALPTDCPGRAMTDAELDAVYLRQEDYRDGTGWFVVGDFDARAAAPDAAAVNPGPDDPGEKREDGR